MGCAIVLGIVCFIINPVLGLAYVVSVIIIFILKYTGAALQEWRLSKLRMQALEYGINFNGAMTGAEFEQVFAELLRRLGCRNVFVTKQSGDYGVDVVVDDSGGRSVFQCKWYTGTVGVKPVQEVFAGKAHYDAKNAFVVTNSTFTKNAIVLAESTGVNLWDRDVLYNLIEKVKKQEEQKK